MGRTIRSATQTWIEEEKALGRFARALRKEDQRAMMELINLSRLHIAESSYASNLYPMDVYLISMLLEMFKRVQRDEATLAEVCKHAGIELPSVSTEISEFPDLVDLIESLDQADA